MDMESRSNIRGQAARAANLGLDANPFPEGSLNWTEWKAGWQYEDLTRKVPRDSHMESLSEAEVFNEWQGG